MLAREAGWPSITLLHLDPGMSPLECSLCNWAPQFPSGHTFSLLALFFLFRFCPYKSITIITNQYSLSSRLTVHEHLQNREGHLSLWHPREQEQDWSTECVWFDMHPNFCILLHVQCWAQTTDPNVAKHPQAHVCTRTSFQNSNFGFLAGAVAHACNPSYSGGSDQDCGSEPAPIARKTLTQKNPHTKGLVE
jgi:hypothetical protein